MTFSRCRALDVTPPARFAASPSINPRPFSTAMSSACSRAFTASRTDPREKQTNAQLWQLAEELVRLHRNIKIHANRRVKVSPSPGGEGRGEGGVKLDQNSCSHLNQSLMELGALICTPRSPNCATCPVQKLCIARKENLQEQLPNLGQTRSRHRTPLRRLRRRARRQIPRPPTTRWRRERAPLGISERRSRSAR